MQLEKVNVGQQELSLNSFCKDLSYVCFFVMNKIFYVTQR